MMEANTNPSARPMKKTRADLTIESHLKTIKQPPPVPDLQRDNKEVIRKRLQGAGCNVPESW